MNGNIEPPNLLAEGKNIAVDLQQCIQCQGHSNKLHHHYCLCEYYHWHTSPDKSKISYHQKAPANNSALGKNGCN